ncbi:sodium-coupled monocarboxylate transporter 2 [Rhipicephalus sanguineus]|uniref:sodium-coupled monocarboxylate transporter 2 n=1 Tax=Rhipicephalus sanguineus TaxID=34632 RepID=UPI0018951716|nr:sodium-coupled monocarboxylate transporter 2 [Rhipicephalus sanguineus]
MTVRYFHPADYGVLVAVMGLSSFIGVYFAWKDRRSTNNKEFLVGNRQLQVFPVTMSMMASFLSAVAILGVPSESFMHGSQYMINFIGIVVGIILAVHVFLPVFYEIDMISVNQYLEKRFNSVLIRKLTSLMTTIQLCFYMGVVLYAPSLALGSVTGLPVWLSILLNGGVCAFYTAIGGIKAVVWTDVIQMVLMVSGLLIVLIQGLIMTGGPAPVIEAVDKHGLLEFFDISFDMQKTFTFWSVVIGCSVTWSMGFCTNQSMIQRFCALGSIRKARTALYINMLGVAVTMMLAVFCGLVLFTLYHQCDPVKASIINKYDELMPYFVMDTFHRLPGIAGLFVTAVYSGSLSTMSSGYNALAAITWEDFLKAKVKLSPRGTMWVTKAIAAGYGILTVVIAFLAGSLPSVMSATFVTTGSFGGASGATFFVGLLVPWCGSLSALLSMVTGMGLSFWVAIGGMLYPAKPVAVRTTLEQCTFNYTTRVPIHRTYYTGGIYDLYHVSYLWIPVISFLTTFIVNVLITLLCGFKNSADVDPSLIAPFMRKLYSRTITTKHNEQKCGSPKAENNVAEKPAKKLHDISIISNGHVNYAMTNDDGTQNTAM